MRIPAVTVTRSIRHGEQDISFDLVKTDRKTLGLTVHRDGRVVARAPRRAREADVLTWVAGHADWIVRKQQAVARLEPRTPPLRYVDGETHLYLGRRCRLAIEQGEVDGVCLAGDRLRVTASANASAERVKELMDDWYAHQACEQFAARLDACWAAFSSAEGHPPALRVKRMGARWGSMSPRRSMSLRLDLIRAPVECIDYVIFHELCHLVHPNHGREFWALVEELVPDWKCRKNRLELILA
jgi:predicted metal-dependent hydrolase